MLLSSTNSNNTTVIHLEVPEVKNMAESDHDNSMEDTLEAEISKLESTINELEVDNDLPNIDNCAYDTEEYDILNSVIYNADDASSIILNTVSHKKQNEPKPLIKLINSVEPPKTVQASGLRYSSGPKTSSSQKCLVELLKVEESNNVDITFQQDLKIHNKVMSDSMKSVIISNNHEEVSFTSQDCELGTNSDMVHLNSVNKTDIAFTTGHGKNAEKSKPHSLLIDKSINSALTRSFENENCKLPQESHLQVDASKSEDELLYPEDDGSSDVACLFAGDNGPMVSSTPLRIKLEPQKRWKPKFVQCEESFLVLDESGECSDQEQSVYKYSSVWNTSIQSAAAAHSTESKSSTHNSMFLKLNEDSNIGDVKIKGNNDMKQIQVASDDARDVKIVVKVGDEADDNLQLSCARPSPVLTNSSHVRGHRTQEIVPVVETKAIMRTGTEFGGNNTNIIPEGNQNVLDQKENVRSKCNEDYISNNPQENDDNNNPDWELLRKLETDEERYRAMRQRWRNLTVPNPNQDLTCRNWRIHQNGNKLTASAVSTSKSIIIQQPFAGESGTSVSMPVHHKRILSDEQASSEHQPRLKHPRTQSCTAVYDIKLDQLRKNINHEKQQIYDQEKFALMQLDIKQTQEMNYLQNFSHIYDISEQKRMLYYQQQWVGNYRCNFCSVNKSPGFN
jgi:hypothetical protein